MTLGSGRGGKVIWLLMTLGARAGGRRGQGAGRSIQPGQGGGGRAPQEGRQD